MSILNKNLAKELIEEWQNTRFFNQRVPEFISENCFFQSFIGDITSCEGLKGHLSSLFSAFPDFKTNLKNIECFGDVVVCGVEFLGTHDGTYVNTDNSVSDFKMKFAELEPTRVRIKQPAEQVFFFKKGKLIRCLIQEDSSFLYKQLGLSIEDQTHSSTESLEKAFYFLKDRIASKCIVPLSRREIESVSLTFAGMSAKAMAEHLFLSPRTIETHLLHAYQKLNCKGKREAFDLFFESGLIPLWSEFSNLFLQNIKAHKGK